MLEILEYTAIRLVRKLKAVLVGTLRKTSGMIFGKEVADRTPEIPEKTVRGIIIGNDSAGNGGEIFNNIISAAGLEF
jgi:hypothetical protein